MKLKFLTIGLIVCGLATVNVNAQKSNSGIILKGGLNLANISKDDAGNIDENKTLATFQAGFVADMVITDFLSIQPGVFYSSKGAKYTNRILGTDIETKINPQYVEVPLNLVFKTPTQGVKFFAGAGPYAAVGVGGKYTATASGLVNGKYEESINWSKDDPLTSEEEGAGVFRMRRFDYGLNALAGVELDRFVITANYGHGLAKIQSGSDSESNDKNKHRVFSVSLGIRL